MAIGAPQPVLRNTGQCQFGANLLNKSQVAKFPEGLNLGHECRESVGGQDLRPDPCCLLACTAGIAHRRMPRASAGKSRSAAAGAHASSARTDCGTRANYAAVPLPCKASRARELRGIPHQPNDACLILNLQLALPAGEISTAGPAPAPKTVCTRGATARRLHRPGPWGCAAPGAPR